MAGAATAPGEGDEGRPPDPNDPKELEHEVERDERFMGEALALAREAAGVGDIPIGCVVVRGDEVVGRGFNVREAQQRPTGHAEVVALEEAARATGSWRLSGCTVYVTLEPCAMCAGALVNARVQDLVFGTADPKAGFCGSLGDIVRDSRLNHRLVVRSGVRQVECRSLLQEFFGVLRARTSEHQKR